MEDIKQLPRQVADNHHTQDEFTMDMQFIWG
jgi:hypothetical protein